MRISSPWLGRLVLLTAVLGTMWVSASASAQSAAATTQATTTATLRAAGRIVNQTTFGATSSALSHAESIGITAFIDEQLAETPYLMPSVIPQADYNGGDCAGWECAPEGWWWHNILFGQDQLRQRVAFALSKLFVVSLGQVDGRYYPYYLNLLSTDAFGNWYTLMQDVSYSGAMGTYLNAANSVAPAAGGHADENFARELMQLFSIGTNALNQDGSLKQDGNGKPVPNYTPAIVQGFARAYTGFTFANPDCSQPAKLLYYYWPIPPGQYCPMLPIESYHDKNAKTLLRGQTLPAGQGAKADFDAALKNVFNDPSLPPFVSRRLIQNLVKSNPSAAYISRIAAVFINDGTGTRGNLKAVIRAILLDTEAREDDVVRTPDASTGLMRDPVLWWASIQRAFMATNPLGEPWVGIYDQRFNLWLTDLDESPHKEPSVFSFYSPLNTLSDSSLYAPEFENENPHTLSWMMLHVQDAIDNNFALAKAGEYSLDLSASSALGSIAKNQGASALVSTLNALLMHGTMSAQMQASILSEVSGLDSVAMTKNAVYLIVTSPQYRIMI